VRHCQSTASVPPVVGSHDSDRPDVAWWGRSASPPVWMSSRPGTKRRGCTTGSSEGARRWSGKPCVPGDAPTWGCAPLAGRCGACRRHVSGWGASAGSERRAFLGVRRLGACRRLARLGAVAVASALLWPECAVGLRKERPWLGEGRAVTRSRASVHCPRSGRCAAELGMAPFRRCVLGRGGCRGF
jgi:hypothetical protein